MLQVPAANAYLAKNRSECFPSLTDVLQSFDSYHVFVCGQNLHTVTTETRTLEAIRSYAARAGQTKIDFLLCDPCFRAGVEAWATVHPEQRGYDYKTHLLDSVRNLLMLQEEFGRTKVRVKVAPLVPFSGWFCEPEDEEGLMGMTFIVPDSRDSSQRPRLVMSRAAVPEIFEFCWSRLRLIFNDGILSREPAFTDLV